MFAADMKKRIFYELLQAPEKIIKILTPSLRQNVARLQGNQDVDKTQLEH